MSRNKSDLSNFSSFTQTLKLTITAAFIRNTPPAALQSCGFGCSDVWRQAAPRLRTATETADKAPA